MSSPKDTPAPPEHLDAELLNVLLDELPDLIYFKDVNSRYVRINRAHARFLGVANPADAIGHTVDDFVATEHASVSLREDREVVATGVPVEGKEEKVTFKDGRTIWVSTSKRPWRDAQGRILGTIGIIRDIDATKRAQERIETEHALLRTIIDHLPTRIFVKDADARFVVNNREHLNSLGIGSQAEATGRRTLDFYPGDRGLQAQEDDRQVLGGGPAIMDQEKSDFGEEGHTRWALTTKVPLKNQEGSIVGLVGISHDITLRKRYEEELRRRAQEMETDLRMACQLQNAFFPQSYPVFPPGVAEEQSRLRFAHRYIPAATLGGDFFDVMRVSDHEAGVLICDVMGHGVRAGLITALIRGLVQELSAAAGEPAKMLGEINRGLAPFLSQTGLPVFASVFYATIDVQTSAIRFANAGHPAPYVLRRGSGVVEALKSTNPEPAAGLVADFEYSEARLPFAAGDGLFLFSDGLFEAADSAGSCFGEERLHALVARHVTLNGAALLDIVLDTVRAHGGDAGFEDDICMLLVDSRG